MQSRPRRIIVSGWFRCGNKWLARLLGYYLPRTSIEVSHFEAGYYWDDFHWDRTASQCDTCFVHTRRDPRDAFVSWYYLLALSENSVMPAGVTFKEYLTWLLTQEHLPFRRYTEGWLKLLARKPHNMLTTSHERAMADRAGVLRRLVTAMGYSIDEGGIQRAAAQSAGEDGRPRYEGGQWVGERTVARGTAGEWKRHFDAADARLIEDAYGDLIERLGYGGDEHWSALLAGKG